jgi:hypothetical protein
MTDDDYTMGDLWRGVREARKERRRAFGVPCPGCNIKQPKREPTIMLPGQRCKVCGHVDRRPRE